MITYNVFSADTRGDFLCCNTASIGKNEGFTIVRASNQCTTSIEGFIVTVRANEGNTCTLFNAKHLILRVPQIGVRSNLCGIVCGYIINTFRKCGQRKRADTY